VGFSSIWASQHYLSDPFTYFQPIPTLARLAADARGMILGTGVLLLPLHHPVEIAEQLATLDVISDGRLVFGVGLGYRDVENRALGQDPKDRVSCLVEGARGGRAPGARSQSTTTETLQAAIDADLDAPAADPGCRCGWPPTATAAFMRCAAGHARPMNPRHRGAPSASSSSFMTRHELDVRRPSRRR
jgi:hypothetical protein